MHILLSNDDGYDYCGLNDLSEALPDDWRITIVAPDRQRSAQSHALTIADTLLLKKHESCKPNITKYSLSGTPADCTKFALEYLLKDDRPDLVLAGVNDGYNLGSDALYSGTVSAAMESLFVGIPSMAISIRHYSTELAKEFHPFIIDFIEKVFIKGQFNGLINMNLPENGPYTWDKVVVVEQGLQRYNDAIEKIAETDEGNVYQIRGELIFDHELILNDVNMINRGNITVTSLTWKQLDEKNLAKLKNLTREFIANI